ncbi:MAG: NUDIX domain-containing protein [Chloroflexota bacterium]
MGPGPGSGAASELGRAVVPIAVHVFVMRSDEVLLLRRAGTGYQDGRLSVVAGHVEAGESATRAAVREAAEEVGIQISAADLAPVGVMHRFETDERVDFFFVVRRWEGTVTNREPHKCSELRWSPVDGLPEDMVPYVRRAIEMLGEGVWFGEFGWEAGSAN